MIPRKPKMSKTITRHVNLHSIKRLGPSITLMNKPGFVRPDLGDL